MASTISLVGDWLVSFGNKRQTQGTGNLGTLYAAGGIAVTPAQVGLGVIDSLLIQPAGGYVFEYVPSTGKVKAYLSGLASGTITAPDVVVTGGQAAGPGLQITPDTNAGVLGKVAATTRTIPGGTFGIGAQTFSGTNDGFTEAGAINLSAVTFSFVALGR